MKGLYQNILICKIMTQEELELKKMLEVFAKKINLLTVGERNYSALVDYDFFENKYNTNILFRAKNGKISIEIPIPVNNSKKIYLKIYGNDRYIELESEIGNLKDRFLSEDIEKIYFVLKETIEKDLNVDYTLEVLRKYFTMPVIRNKKIENLQMISKEKSSESSLNLFEKLDKYFNIAISKGAPLDGYNRTENGKYYIIYKDGKKSSNFGSLNCLKNHIYYGYNVSKQCEANGPRRYSRKHH